MSLTSTIKSIQDIMRKDDGVDGDAQRIGQLAWMLFLKIFDDQEQEALLLKDNYRSPIPKPFRWSTWAADPEGMTGDELLDFVNNQMFPKFKNLSLTAANGRARVVRDAFEDAYNYMKSGHLMRQVINKINASIDFNKAEDRHLFGDIYEKLLKDLQSAGNAGEYYTPRGRDAVHGRYGRSPIGGNPPRSGLWHRRVPGFFHRGTSADSAKGPRSGRRCRTRSTGWRRNNCRTSSARRT